MRPLSPNEARRLAAAAAAFVVNTVAFAAQIYAGSFYDKTPYHTSALTAVGRTANMFSDSAIKCSYRRKGLVGAIDAILQKELSDLDIVGNESNLTNAVMDGISAQYLDPIRDTHNSSRFTVFGVDGNIVDPSLWHEYLTNALVELTFGLSYSRTDGLFAEVEMISILK